MDLIRKRTQVEHAVLRDIGICSSMSMLPWGADFVFVFPNWVMLPFVVVSLVPVVNEVTPFRDSSNGSPSSYWSKVRTPLTIVLLIQDCLLPSAYS